MARGKSGGKPTRASVPQPAIPDKLYIRIGEVARLLDLPTYVLRFWESEFPHLRPTKGGTGQRLYRRHDVEALVEVRRLLYDEGYTIPGARRLLEDRGKPAPAQPVPLSEEDLPGGATSVVSDHLRDDALQQVHTALRELARVLSRPAQAGSLVSSANTTAGVRRRSAAHDDLPTLFAWPDDHGPGKT